MDKLNWVHQICNRNQDDAFGTQATRWRSRDLMARELCAANFKPKAAPLRRLRSSVGQ
jgi:hypothetical protein